MIEEQNDRQEDQAPDANDGGQQSDSEPRTFTQAEMNAIISDRVRREREKYADYDDLKEAASQWQEHRKAQMSELEKAQQRIQELEAATQQAQEQAKQTLIRSAFVATAAQLGAAHPEDAYRLADTAGVTIDDEGNVLGVEDAVQTLVEAGRLVMAGKPRAPNLDAATGSGTRTRDQGNIARAVAQLTPAEVHTAKAMGLTPEQYAESKLQIQS